MRENMIPAKRNHMNVMIESTGTANHIIRRIMMDITMKVNIAAEGDQHSIFIWV